MLRHILALIPLLALAQVPDRAPKPEEWGYHPEDGVAVAVNPPALTWVSDGNALRFSVQWSQSKDLSGAVTVTGLPWGAYTHNKPLRQGHLVLALSNSSGPGRAIRMEPYAQLQNRR